jgi:hypothetical protein
MRRKPEFDGCWLIPGIACSHATLPHCHEHARIRCISDHRGNQFHWNGKVSLYTAMSMVGMSDGPQGGQRVAKPATSGVLTRQIERGEISDFPRRPEGHGFLAFRAAPRRYDGSR